MAAKVISIGQPVNDAERQAIAHLRTTLPNTCTIIHNFEIRQGKQVYEIDLAVLTPHCVFVVDVKDVGGPIDIYGSKWHPEGRPPYTSPLAKLRQHAKVLKSLICDTNSTIPELRKIHVHAAILMTAPNAHIVDHSGLDGDDVVQLKKSLIYFQDKARIPTERLSDIRSYLHLIEQTIVGKAQPKSAPITYREWQVEEQLGGDDHYIEYRAKHSLMGKRGGLARLRVYQVDPYQDTATRQAERNRISNAFRAVAHMDPHPNILTVREFFQTEAEDRFVLVTEDVAGVALSQHIKKQSLALTFDQKLGIMRDVLTALDHAHKFAVIHRNLTPDAILITVQGRARLTSFDYARVGKDRTSTIAGEIVDDLDVYYQAPECYREPTQASIASDLFSAGLIFYELLVGEPAFKDNEQMFDLDGIFPVKPSELKPDLPTGLDAWLQKLCAFDPEERFPSAAVALYELDSIIVPATPKPKTVEPETIRKVDEERDYHNLVRDDNLGGRFKVQERLGKPGGFGVAYKVFDSFGDRILVLKLITRDRRSVFERLRREYVTLLHLPEHPNVVKVIWADKLPDDTPYLAFEYLSGLDVAEMISAETVSIEDAVKIVKEAANGLIHLHRNSVYHLDIKPSNLFWTDKGVRLIDFNVSTANWNEEATAGGTRRYMPPDLDLNLELTTEDKVDRDLYALGITFYECLTRCYPFDEPIPSPKKPVGDPREIAGYEDLSNELVELLLKMIAPNRADRFQSAEVLYQELANLKNLRKPKTQLPLSSEQLIPLFQLEPSKPNFNPFVSHLLTLYSQSKRTNAGTRGLDAIGEATYISTRLDEELRPAILNGEFKLVIISGNAGDGKTAFIQQSEKAVEQNGVQVTRGLNGATFQWQGRTFITNYDGSQDEGNKTNQEVLLTFFSPFQGNDPGQWPTQETRLIAINEGRLVDFLTTHEKTFPMLASIVQKGLSGADAEHGVILINLNLRSVVANSQTSEDSIFDRLLRRLTAPQFWTPCQECDLKDRCYIYHNAQTFMDPVAGPKVIERLKTLYMISHVRGRLHITLRDLRSALAFMLAGTRDCDEVHNLYGGGSNQAQLKILNSFYFNSCLGGDHDSADRLISLLGEIDVGLVNNPDLDRAFAFLGPTARRQSRFTFTDRGTYDDDLFSSMFEKLLGARGNLGGIRSSDTELHANYIVMLRRRHYFERRDGREEGWRQMLPYRQADHFLGLFLDKTNAELQTEVRKILNAINRGEGLINPERLGHELALRVREVKNGTIRSYRLFDGSTFSLVRPELGKNQRFIEYLPQALLLQHLSTTGDNATLTINLDIYEMLTRLNNGYRPSVEELQGFYLSLVVFKNVLASAPYQEVLLTETGYEFYRITREQTGQLRLEPVSEGKI